MPPGAPRASSPLHPSQRGAPGSRSRPWARRRDGRPAGTLRRRRRRARVKGGGQRHTCRGTSAAGLAASPHASPWLRRCRPRPPPAGRCRPSGRPPRRTTTACPGPPPSPRTTPHFRPVRGRRGRRRRGAMARPWALSALLGAAAVAAAVGVSGGAAATLNGTTVRMATPREVAGYVSGRGVACARLRGEGGRREGGGGKGGGIVWVA